MIRIHSTAFDNMNPDWQLSEHRTQVQTLILVVRGKLTYHLNGNTVPLEKGDFLYYPQGTVRAAYNAPDGPHQKYFVQFKVDHPAPFKLPDDFCKIRTPHYDYLKQRFIGLNQQWFAQMPHYQTICQGIVLELIGHMAREGEMEQFASIKLRLMEMVREHIIEHYREPVRISDLAELIDRAPNYITQTFKEITGLTPITYMHHLRVQRARTLILSNTRMTIGEISDHLGYNDQSHFNKMFKKIMGCPPSALMQSLNAKS
jgi:AraC-like DNA-binding protein